MNEADQDAIMIAQELTSDDAKVRGEFMKLYADQAKGFAKAMGIAFSNWRTLDAMVGDDEHRAYVIGLAYVAITLHIMSMKLLLSGQIVAAGNLYRQVVETMALALLCSAGKELPVLDAFIAGK